MVGLTTKNIKSRKRHNKIGYNLYVDDVFQSTMNGQGYFCSMSARVLFLLMFELFELVDIGFKYFSLLSLYRLKNATYD